VGDAAMGDAGAPVATTVMFAMGVDHACRLRSDLRLECWGANNRGQLGDGTNISRTDPVLLPGTYRHVSAGAWFTCAVTNKDGWLACWGAGSDHRLGSGGHDALTPRAVVGEPGSGFETRRFTEVHTMEGGACALSENLEVWCWGYNTHGEMGNGTSGAGQPRARRTSHPFPTLALATGSRHACALHGTYVSCWGHGAHGQMGDGTTTVTNPTPEVVSLPPGVELTSLEGLRNATCGITTLGTVACWGDNRFGQLRTTGVSFSATPVVTSTIHPANTLRCGNASCFLRTGSTRTNMAWQAWGLNQHEQITSPPDASTGIRFLAWPAATRVFADAPSVQTCATWSSGTSACWGEPASLNRSF
jgi:alpha-tubulin suppressor-like RCC1 family protein